MSILMVTKNIRIKIIGLFFVVLLIAGYVSAEIIGDIFQEEIVSEACGDIIYINKKIAQSDPLYFVTGRLYVPLVETLTDIGATIQDMGDLFLIKYGKRSFEVKKENDSLLYKQLHYENNKPYLYIYDLAKLLNISVVFDSNNNTVSLFKCKTKTAYNANEENICLEKAFLRLEDVTADFGIGGNFTDEGLEKLRVISDYLSEKGQAFYIAWIPLYTNPLLQIHNDLTENFNFYNAGFLYTLDYIINHNGKIVLHGLTHQENDTTSAIGTEFGPNTPFSLDEIEDRIKRAKEIAKTLSFENNIFEFPHYSFTQKQLEIVERHFDVICQQYPYAKKYGFLEKIVKWNSVTTYIPTPLGYVNSIDEISDTIKKIDKIESGHFMGIFMHPYMDFNKIKCFSTSNGVRDFSYDNNSIIPLLVNKTTEKGYVFSEIN